MFYVCSPISGLVMLPFALHNPLFSVTVQYESTEHHLTTFRLSTSYLSLQSFNDEFMVYSNYMWNELREDRVGRAAAGSTYCCVCVSLVSFVSSRTLLC